MPVDAIDTPLEGTGGTYVNTEQYPADSFGHREIPIIHRDIYGRKSRIEMKKVNQYEYHKWLKENRNEQRSSL